jgi:hypothetical protein
MSYLSYARMNALEEFSFIAGTDYTLTFEVFEGDGVSPADIGGGTIKWVLSPMGQPEYNILELDGAITSANEFEVEIPSAATQTFSGKYIQQPVLIDFDGQEFRPAQGVITIIPRIPLTS